MHKETAQLRESAVEKMAPTLFPVADTLDLYIAKRPFESEEFQNSEAKGAFDGLEVAKKQFNAAMLSIKMTEIVPQIGDDFDPSLHEACMEVDVPPNCQPGQIGLVLRSGWVKERSLLRPAEVGIARTSDIHHVSDAEEKDIA